MSCTRRVYKGRMLGGLRIRLIFIHVHGQRFLVLGRDDAHNSNLAWKDTVLVRMDETVDIMLETSNPGLWMEHCHIAEHAEAGMMFIFLVTEDGLETRP